MWKQRVWLKPKKQKSEHPEVKGSAHTLCFWKGAIDASENHVFQNQKCDFQKLQTALFRKQLGSPTAHQEANPANTT